MNLPITDRQKQLLKNIYHYIKDTGYPPTFEEMKDSLQVKSNQSVIDLLGKLERKKYLQRHESMARSIAILPLGYQALGRPPLAPFLGITHAGLPTQAVTIEGEWQTVSGEVSRLKDEIFILKISGDSMINAGIDDGDMVLVKSQKEFVSGEVVLAQVGDEATVKRFISQRKPPYMYLKPENPKYQIILFTSHVRMSAKVISILKQGQWLTVQWLKYADD